MNPFFISQNRSVPFIDGRSKNMLASKNMVDMEEHRGSLYWVVSRTSEAKDVNLDVEMSMWTQSIEMSLPAPKKRKTETCTLDASMMPTVPILVNKTRIKENIQLLVFQPQKKQDKAEKPVDSEGP